MEQRSKFSFQFCSFYFNPFQNMAKFTLEEIAKQAGVAKSTVYRVINNSGSASSETRQRIQEAVAVLEKNATANRQPPVEATHHLAVVYPSVWSPQREGLYKIYYRSIYHAASELGFVLHLISYQGEESALRLIQEFQQEGLIQLDSVVAMGLSEEDETLLAFQQRGIPVCLLGRYMDQNSRFSWVGVNYQEGSAIALQHLTSLGHRRIVLASQGHPSNSYHRWHRSAYQRVFEEQGLALDPGLILERAEQAVPAIVELVRQGATAVYATTDELAATVYQSLSEQGLRVPDDVSIIGFNDLTAADHTPPITAIYWPHHLVGQLGVQVIANLLETPRSKRSILFCAPSCMCAPPPARFASLEEKHEYSGCCSSVSRETFLSCPILKSHAQRYVPPQPGVVPDDLTGGVMDLPV
jgi:LacI family transcriptional regulator